MIPDVKEAEEEGKQKAKQVNDDLEVCGNTEKAINFHSIDSIVVFMWIAQC